MHPASGNRISYDCHSGDFENESLLRIEYCLGKLKSINSVLPCWFALSFVIFSFDELLGKIYEHFWSIIVVRQLIALLRVLLS
jgi:hypothetical protein